MHYAFMVHDHYIKLIWIIFWYARVREITKIQKSYKKIGIRTLFWHGAKVYFMCIKPLVVDHCTQHEQKQHIYLKDLANMQHLWNNGHKCILAQSPCLFYMHQSSTVVDHCTKYQQNPSSHHGGMHGDGQTRSYTSQFRYCKCEINRKIGE